MLSAEEITRLAGEGAAMTIDQVVAYALEDGETTRPAEGRFRLRAVADRGGRVRTATAPILLIPAAPDPFTAAPP